MTLFERTRREVRMTPEGNRLKRHAELLLAEWCKARQDLTAGGAANQLRLAIEDLRAVALDVPGHYAPSPALEV